MDPPSRKCMTPASEPRRHIAMWAVAALVVVLASAPLAASAQTIASPVGEVGVVPVGTPTTFHVFAQDGQGVPPVHSDVPVRVLLDDVVLYETPQQGTIGAHEYDGVHTFTIAFARTGTYRVQALAGDGSVHSEVTGQVIALPWVEPVFEGHVEDDVPIQAHYTVGVPHAEHPLHTETFVSIMETGRLVLQTKLHDHSDGQGFTWRAAAPGTVQTVHSVLQGGDGPIFPPFAHESGFTSRAVPVSLEGLVLPEPQMRNAATRVEGEGMVLVATYDPYTVVGPDTLMRIAILALDPTTLRPMPHTQFEATLRGPAGEEFHSDALHEHDGVWEFVARRPVGSYALEVHATQGENQADITANWLVIPPVEARGAGDVQLAVNTLGQVVGGQTTRYIATTRDAAGPVGHVEVLVDVLDTQGVPVLRTKAHSHADGMHHWDMALPEGEYTLRVESFPLEARPRTSAVEELTLQVAPDPARSLLDITADAPAPALAWLFAALAIALVTAIRRHR